MKKSKFKLKMSQIQSFLKLLFAGGHVVVDVELILDYCLTD
jgi:hypothetical protein